MVCPFSCLVRVASSHSPSTQNGGVGVPAGTDLVVVRVANSTVRGRPSTLGEHFTPICSLVPAIAEALRVCAAKGKPL